MPTPGGRIRAAANGIEWAGQRRHRLEENLRLGWRRHLHFLNVFFRGRSAFGRPDHLSNAKRKIELTKSEARVVSPGFVWFRVRKRTLRVIAASGVGMLRRMSGELSYEEPFAGKVCARPLRVELRRPKFWQSENPQNRLALR
jgi:hypothetical protein